jgi:hypothetical protein
MHNSVYIIYIHKSCYPCDKSTTKDGCMYWHLPLLDLPTSSASLLSNKWAALCWDKSCNLLWTWPNGWFFYKQIWDLEVPTICPSLIHSALTNPSTLHPQTWSREYFTAVLVQSKIAHYSCVANFKQLMNMCRFIVTSESYVTHSRQYYLISHPHVCKNFSSRSSLTTISTTSVSMAINWQSCAETWKGYQCSVYPPKTIVHINCGQRSV